MFLFQFAANYARDNLIKNINNKIVELKNFIATGNRPKPDHPPTSGDSAKKDAEKKPDAASVEKKNSFRKTMSTSQTDECMKKGASLTDPELLSRLDTLARPITREVRPSRQDAVARPAVPTSSYVDANGNINYRQLLTDEVLAADRILVEAAKKSMDVAGMCLIFHITTLCRRCHEMKVFILILHITGTTALIALLEGSRLVVANVGDSRGVMCDSKGNAIPLSFDHKPQQVFMIYYTSRKLPIKNDGKI